MAEDAIQEARSLRGPLQEAGREVRRLSRQENREATRLRIERATEDVRARIEQEDKGIERARQDLESASTEKERQDAKKNLEAVEKSRAWLKERLAQQTRDQSFRTLVRNADQAVRGAESARREYDRAGYDLKRATDRGGDIEGLSKEVDRLANDLRQAIRTMLEALKELRKATEPPAEQGDSGNGKGGGGNAAGGAAAGPQSRLSKGPVLPPIACMEVDGKPAIPADCEEEFCGKCDESKGEKCVSCWWDKVPAPTDPAVKGKGMALAAGILAARAKGIAPRPGNGELLAHGMSAAPRENKVDGVRVRGPADGLVGGVSGQSAAVAPNGSAPISYQASPEHSEAAGAGLPGGGQKPRKEDGPVPGWSEFTMLPLDSAPPMGIHDMSFDPTTFDIRVRRLYLNESVTKELLRLRSEIQRKLEQEHRAEVQLAILEAKGSHLQEGVRAALLTLRKERFALEASVLALHRKYGMALESVELATRLEDQLLVLAGVASLPNELIGKVTTFLEAKVFADLEVGMAAVMWVLGKLGVADEEWASVILDEAVKDYQWALSQTGAVEDPGGRTNVDNAIIGGVFKAIEILIGGPIGEDESALRALAEGFLRTHDPLEDQPGLTDADRARLARMRFLRLLLYLLLALLALWKCLCPGGKKPPSGKSKQGDKGALPSSASASEATIRADLKGLKDGKNPSSSKLVGSESELRALYDKWSSGGTPIQGSSYGKDFVRLPDGTTVGMRPKSDSGGTTVDVTFPNKKHMKVHIK
jgi:hypothetical protein